MLSPEISVVICTYNREKFIISALESLMQQSLSPGKYEVLIVDNNSTDNTAALCKQFIESYPGYNLRYIFEENKGLSHARNRGIREARSEIITFIDDDAEVTSSFLEKLVVFFQSHPEAVGAGGKIIPRYPESPEPEWMNPYLDGFVAAHDHGDLEKKYAGKMKYPAGCNMSYRKPVLEQVNGFETGLTFRSDDKSIYQRVKKISGNIWYVPQAVLYHNIDAERIQFPSFKKLYLKTGNEEKRRVRAEKGAAALILKFFEFVLKAKISIFIWLLYTFKGKAIKGKYVWLSQWFTLKGFLMKEVFVR